MKHDPILSGKRKPVNLSIDSGVAAAARELGINMSKVTEAALHEATRTLRAERWKEENRPRLEAWNDWLETHGLPYAELRVW